MNVGILTTWNQACGLATYARYLLAHYPPASYVVLAEKTSATTSPDESFVERCWTREKNDFESLRAIVRKHKLNLLHLNFHDHSFIPDELFLSFLSSLRKDGVLILSHLHTTFTADDRLRRFIAAVDGLIVHTPENRLQVIANGAPPDRVFIVPHGIHQTPPLSADERRSLRARYQVALGEKLILGVGFIQPNKGMEGIIEAVLHLRSRGIPARGFIVGKVNEQHPQAHAYFLKLQEIARQVGVGQAVSFINQFVSDGQLIDYLLLSDLVMMNYQSQYHEASGACALAIGAGALVACSLAPTFDCFGDAIWRMTAGYPPGVSAELLLCGNSALPTVLRQNARLYAEKHQWSNIARQISAIYRQVNLADYQTGSTSTSSLLDILPVL